MTNDIVFSINEYLEDTYPNLTFEQIDLIASDVKRRWDFQPLIEQVDMKVQQTAYYSNIELKEGLQSVLGTK